MGCGRVVYIGYVDDYVIIVSLAKVRRCSLVHSLVKSLFPIQSQGIPTSIYIPVRECTTAHMLSSPILPCGGTTKTSNAEGVVNEHKSEASPDHSLLTRWRLFAVATTCSTNVTIVTVAHR